MGACQLAVRFDGLMRDYVVSNQSELATLARVTQPRMTQILNLLHLAPDIEEALCSCRRSCTVEIQSPSVISARSPQQRTGILSAEHGTC